MLRLDAQPNLLRLLILLTAISVIGEIYFLWISSLNTDLIDSFVSASVAKQLLHTKIFIFGLLQFVLSQLVIHSLFVFVTWYLTVSIGALFKLTDKQTYFLGLLIWFALFIFIYVANAIYSTHSFFANVLHQSPL